MYYNSWTEWTEINPIPTGHITLKLTFTHPHKPTRTYTHIDWPGETKIQIPEAWFLHLGGILTPLSSWLRSAACRDSCRTSPSHCCSWRLWDTESADINPVMDKDTYEQKEWLKCIFYSFIFINCNCHQCDPLFDLTGLTRSLTTSGMVVKSSNVTSCLSGKRTTLNSSSYCSCSTSNPPSMPGKNREKGEQREKDWKSTVLYALVNPRDHRHILFHHLNEIKKEFK